MKNCFLLILLFTFSDRCMEHSQDLAPWPDVCSKKEYSGGWFKLNEDEIAPTDLAQWFSVHGPVDKPYDIRTLCKATLLKNLFECARSSVKDSDRSLPESDIITLLESRKPISDIKGRILKVDLSGSTVNLYEYMIYNGRKAGEIALIKTIAISNNPIAQPTPYSLDKSYSSTGDL